MDADGNPFDIHHKDGDPFNNDLENLEALSMADHYVRHLSQGDIGAAWAIAMRMKIPAAERKAASDARKGVSHSWGWKISIGLKGKKLSDDHRKNLSESHKGHRHSEETKAKMSASRTGIVVSDETRARRSKSLKGRVMGPEWRAKLSAAKKGKKLWPNGRSPETIAKVKATWAKKAKAKQAMA